MYYIKVRHFIINNANKTMLTLFDIAQTKLNILKKIILTAAVKYNLFVYKEKFFCSHEICNLFYPNPYDHD